MSKEAEMTGQVVGAGQVQPVVVEPIVVQPVAVVIPPAAVVGTVVAVEGVPTGVVVPAGYKPGQTWNIAVPTGSVKQQTGLVGMAQLLGDAQRIEVNQKINKMEALSLGCFEQQNKFEIKLNDKDGPTVMTAIEVSQFEDRCCCKPTHSLLVHFAPAYDQNNVILTMERPGCECKGCCFTSPKPWLGCFTCQDMCIEEIVLHDGKVEGRPGFIEAPKPLAIIRQPYQCCKCYPEGCVPTLHMTAPGDNMTPYATIKGPECFGGCSELCCENHFDYSHENGESAGKIVHLRPRGFGEIAKQICTDSDNYAVEFEPATTASDKANMIAASVLLDYMFFELDNGMIRYDTQDGAIKCTLFMHFCWGKLCPCTCSCGGSNDEG